jgi:hypothetical protein
LPRPFVQSPPYSKFKKESHMHWFGRRVPQAI